MIFKYFVFPVRETAIFVLIGGFTDPLHVPPPLLSPTLKAIREGVSKKKTYFFSTCPQTEGGVNTFVHN